jgi:RNase H-fold protein (predicted Holliday junction resolvase)
LEQLTAPVMGVDPGTRKCGLAVTARAGEEPLLLAIVPLAELLERARSAALEHGVRAIALGKGTHNNEALAALRPLGLPIELVDERETTLRARARYFQANPPRGWRRFVPAGMLLPPRPIDDFAALLIAERLLEAARNGGVLPTQS